RPDDACRLEQAGLFPCEALEARLDHGAQPLGNRRAQCIDAAPELPSPVTPDQQPMLEQMVDERHEEERVALRPVEEEGQELFGEVRSLELLAEIVRDLGAREPVDEDLPLETSADVLLPA